MIITKIPSIVLLTLTLLPQVSRAQDLVPGPNKPALPTFQKLTLTDKYYCDGITAADINRDGKIDIVAGPFWYEGPDFKTKHELYSAKEFPLPPNPTDSMFSYVYDFNGDGWPDILVLGRVHLHAAYWYENPKGAGGLWKKHFVFERIKGESPPFLDVDGDGKPEIVAHNEEYWGLIQPNWSDPTQPWTFKPITDKRKWEQFYHGTGIGDVNGDGRLDLILNEGWYEQPADKNAPWIRHEFKFGDKGGAQMFAYDINGDGRADIITALDAHGWGLAWFENIKDDAGQITFKKHAIMGDRSEEQKFGVAFTQPHALALADIDGDGLLDIVTGKRLWAHGPQGDIEPNEKPVLYWFKLTRDGKGGATYTPHLVDDKSGVGVQLTVADINGDGRPDILTVSKLGTFAFINQAPANANAAEHKTIRVAAAQPKARLVDWHIKNKDEILAKLDVSLTELETLLDRAAKEHCDVVALPEDTLGLGNWEAGNEAILREVLPQAVEKMLKRLGAWAAKNKTYVICCNDHAEADGKIYNTSFFIGRDGKEIGRYHKVCPTLHERVVTPGDRFPVFNTKDLGGVGMLICYDMVFPETARCLALGGADIIFHPTLGGAAIGDDDISKAAFRTRAVENFVYLIVAQRGSGSMIVSPQGKIIAEAKGVDAFAIADIDPFAGREGGDAMNHQRDMRARLFRERTPAAFGILTDPNPPALTKIPATMTERESIDIAHKVLTQGQEDFRAANNLASAGKIDEAIAAFKRLQQDYRDSWIDRVATERLLKLQLQAAPQGPVPQRLPAPKAEAGEKIGLAAKYPSDAGIEKDPKVLFAENFEEPSLDIMKKRWETVTHPEIMSFAADAPPGGGKQSLLMSHIGGKGDGGHLYRRLPPGHDQVFARFYVKFDPDCAPIHHFGTCIGGNNPATPWPSVKAGQRTLGDKSFWVGIEPFGKDWRWDYYTYWCEMRGSPPRGQTWGNSFVRDSNLKVERGKWTCIEVMTKMNDIGDTNGELALWIDGKPISHLGKGFPKGKWVFDKFIPNEGGDSARWNDTKGDRENFTTQKGGEPFEGFRWRTSKDLKVNFVWAYLYLTDAPAGHVSKVWFDNIVVATEYIGPAVDH